MSANSSTIARVSSASPPPVSSSLFDTWTGHGYGALIKAYVHFLLAKLDFHQTHPEFTGNFDYEEYLSLKGVDDLDEGYTLQ